jgi:pSer/pThr/pTyr-binding forkhead associated (FHA) protein
VAAPALEVVAGPAQGSRLAVEGDELLIGRSAEGPGVLGGDSELSRRHAVVRSLPDGRLLIEDLGSTNGTFVNGTQIPAATLLRPGGTVELGGTTLRVVAGAAPAPPAPPAPERHPALRVVAGWAPGAIIPVGEESVTLGTEAAGASALGDDPELAARHAKVTPLADGRVIVEDLGSKAGTRVNGAPIPGPTVLARGERFELGRSTLEVVEAAAGHEPMGEPSRVVGGVQSVPQGLFALIAARAPVTREEVVRVALFSLGWGVAANLLIRTFAIEVLDVEDDLRSLQIIPLLAATVMPITFNSIGFYKLFRRPDETSVKRYLGPTFGIPLLFVILNVARLEEHGALEVLITVVVTVLPIVICAPLMLKLRGKVARERVATALGRG